jgi:hypothetical protein
MHQPYLPLAVAGLIGGGVCTAIPLGMRGGQFGTKHHLPGSFLFGWLGAPPGPSCAGSSACLQILFGRDPAVCAPYSTTHAQGRVPACPARARCLQHVSTTIGLCFLQRAPPNMRTPSLPSLPSVRPQRVHGSAMWGPQQRGPLGMTWAIQRMSGLAEWPALHALRTRVDRCTLISHARHLPATPASSSRSHPRPTAQHELANAV